VEELVYNSCSQNATTEPTNCRAGHVHRYTAPQPSDITTQLPVPPILGFGGEGFCFST